MKKLIKKIKEWWAARVYARQLKKAIKEANRIKQTTKMKCLVVDINGRPLAVTKRELKGFKKAGYIPQNTNLEWVEKSALYNTL